MKVFQLSGSRRVKLLIPNFEFTESLISNSLTAEGKGSLLEVFRTFNFSSELDLSSFMSTYSRTRSCAQRGTSCRNCLLYTSLVRICSGTPHTFLFFSACDLRISYPIISLRPT